MEINRFAGSYDEMGKQQGLAFKTMLHDGLKSFKQLELVRSMKPRWMPASMFLWIAGTIAQKKLEPLFKVHAPRQRERIKGIAAGSGIDERFTWLFTSMEVVMGINDYEIPATCGCTTLVLDGSLMASGHTTIARNFDFATFVVPFLRARKNEPDGCLKSLDITAAPLPGTFNGVNEAGVFISTNEAFPIAEGVRKPGLPASAIIQEALETSNTTQEAIDVFKHKPRGSCNLITIADKHNDFVSLEYTSTDMHEVQPGEGNKFLVATNHYISEDLARIDLPANAVFGKKAPRSLQGTCINQTSRTRRETVNAWMAGQDEAKITSARLLELLRDHSTGNGEGGMETICHHDPENISAASMIIDLEELTTLACLGLPCEHDYDEIAFTEG